ncbi:MAG TPA: choice-of-anchor E domain-containing protein [Opitutaceae bacterium]|nr:choice-of-anchor E domain-containing protein [Opitutaceae bacterium]
MKAVPVLLLAAAGLVPALGYAATISYDVSTSLPSGSPSTLSLTRFDTSLGTLTGITVTLGVNITDTHVQFDNDADTVQTGTAGLRNIVSNFTSSAGGISASAVTSGLAINQTANLTIGANYNDLAGVANFQVGEQDYASWDPALISSSYTTSIGSAYFADWSSLSNITLSLDTSYFTSASISGNNGYGLINTPNGVFAASVTYTYAIPEPATYALVFGALTLGLVGWRRFRK